MRRTGFVNLGEEGVIWIGPEASHIIANSKTRQSEDRFQRRRAHGMRHIYNIRGCSLLIEDMNVAMITQRERETTLQSLNYGLQHERVLAYLLAIPHR